MYAAVAALISRFHKLLSPESIFGPDSRFSPDASLEVLLEMKQRGLSYRSFPRSSCTLSFDAPTQALRRRPWEPLPCVRPPFGRQAPVL